MSYETNPYYHPEVHGLEILAEHEFSTGSYEFDTRVVWKDAKGRLYTARDSGCSCPTPFENYDSLKDLERLTSLVPLKEEYRTATTAGYSNLTGWDEFRDKVAAALRANRTPQPPPSEER